MTKGSSSGKGRYRPLHPRFPDERPLRFRSSWRKRLRVFPQGVDAIDGRRSYRVTRYRPVWGEIDFQRAAQRFNRAVTSDISGNAFDRSCARRTCHAHDRPIRCQMRQRVTHRRILSQNFDRNGLSAFPSGAAYSWQRKRTNGSPCPTCRRRRGSTVCRKCRLHALSHLRQVG